MQDYLNDPDRDALAVPTYLPPSLLTIPDKHQRSAAIKLYRTGRYNSHPSLCGLISAAKAGRINNGAFGYRLHGYRGAKRYHIKPEDRYYAQGRNATLKQTPKDNK